MLMIQAVGSEPSMLNSDSRVTAIPHITSVEMDTIISDEDPLRILMMQNITKYTRYIPPTKNGRYLSVPLLYMLFAS